MSPTQQASPSPHQLQPARQIHGYFLTHLSCGFPAGCTDAVSDSLAQVWRPEHDFALLRSVLQFGYGNWATIADDERLGLKAAVLQMCNIPPSPGGQPFCLHYA